MTTSSQQDRDIHQIIEEGFAKWRAAKVRADPHGHVRIADEAEMRRCITEYECARAGLPVEPGRQQRPTSVEWNVRTYLDAQQSQLTEPPWKIRGLVVECGATQVSAHPHGMKSLSWLNAALESVALHTVWGQFDATNVQRVLYIESEDPEWLVVQRIKGLSKGLGLPPDGQVEGFNYVCPGPFDLVKEEHCLRELFARHRPDFAVLSTLQNMLAGRDWASQKEMQDVNALIVRLARVCPLVVLTHSPWNKEQRRAAGTITQFANFAVTMHYEKVGSSRDSKNGNSKKSRKGPENSGGTTQTLELNASDIDPNDPRLTEEIQEVNLEGDAYTYYRKAKAGDTIHVVVDSKLGVSVGDFHLKLQTESDEVRRLVYGGDGWPKGAGKDAVLDEITNDPNASAAEIANRAGVTDRYVRKVRSEIPKKGSRKTKGKRSGD